MPSKLNLDEPPADTNPFLQDSTTKRALNHVGSMIHIFRGYFNAN
ncbi:MAG: hypothetical protein ACTSWN_00735 [Promethearchaeota archaeon]